MMKKKPRILLNLSLKKKNHINKNAIQTYINEISAKEKLNVMAEKKKEETVLGGIRTHARVESE
ncbi:hypothetical protein [Flavobacterium sp.]|jgi:hypothetical protein|uniref:hypothetical protein n=1 Tax=Flavobacterium sp. TaxID=239 RepID=UPI0037C1A181